MSLTATNNIVYEDLAKVNKPFRETFAGQFQRIQERGWFVLGQEVQLFEEEYAAFHHAPHCIGVANGLDAMILAFKALDIPAGSEVIVPSNTYIASILAILHAGLVPVLVEPDLQTYNINPALLEQAITPATKAVLVVHLYGKCCDMGPILNLTAKYGLALVEDCAQSHGAMYKQQLCGTFGDAGAFSFYPTKNLGALGDGGGILCKQPQLAAKLKQFRNYGSDIKYHNEVIGYNSRLDEIQAAFLRTKLNSLNQINNHKRALASLYLEGLKNDFIKPATHPDFFDVYHIFNIRHEKRDELKAYLHKNGIGSEIHYPVAPHRQKALEHLFTGKTFPVSEIIHQTTLSLPCSFGHTTQEIERVIEILNEF
jgi:dTDP-4-amino-4,6-dideoxygalactose transaminase